MRIEQVKGDITTSQKLKSDKTKIISMANVKGEKSSDFIVPMFLQLLDMKQDKVTEAIHKSIVNLDNLAISIDGLIDEGISYKNKTISINNFDDLSQKIEHCLEPIFAHYNKDKILNETLKAVRKSFVYNTTERHLIYSLDNSIEDTKCTTYYLLPLVKNLCEYAGSDFDPEKLFILASNSVQMIDDFVDLEQGLSTPLTRFYNEQPDKDISNNVKDKLIFYANQMECIYYNQTGKKAFLQDWQKINLCEILPVLCYGG